MDCVNEDSFVLFVRFDRGHTDTLADPIEHALASCPSYEDARRIRQALHGSSAEYVIRFVGEAGGGD